MRFGTFVLTLVVVQLCKTQFHQDDYDIIQDKIELYKYNRTYIKDVYARVVKYNDTLQQKAISFGGFFIKEVKSNFYMNFFLQKKVGKKYRFLPFNFTAELCEEFRKLGQKNPFGIQTAILTSNFRGCPFLAQKHYHINDWILEQDKFPPHSPAGEYALKVSGSVENNDWFFNAAWFGRVVPKKNNKK